MKRGWLFTNGGPHEIVVQTIYLSRKAGGLQRLKVPENVKYRSFITSSGNSLAFYKLFHRQELI